MNDGFFVVKVSISSSLMYVIFYKNNIINQSLILKI